MQIVKLLLFLLTKRENRYIIIIERGKTSNGYAVGLILDSPNLVGGGYLTFFVSAIKNTIVKNIILNMYFNIATTSFPDYKYRN